MSLPLRGIVILGLFFFWGAILSSCTPAPRFRETPVTRSAKQPKHFREGQSWTGKASFYGKDFHGRKTSNGEIFDMHGLTAAHKQLPFGTILKVTNLKNGKSCRVRVNDRGPFVRGRMLDLSLGAAEQLDMVRDGVAEVRVEILSLGRE